VRVGVDEEDEEDLTSKESLVLDSTWGSRTCL
jgi:hypothetical protein